MTRRRRARIPKPDASAIDGALSALSADELRQLVRGILPELDDRIHARVVNRLVDRAARGESGWAPAAPSGRIVAEIVSFAEAAKRVGSADPAEIDDYLREGTNAFLRKDYAAAFTIFRALLLPAGHGEIDLGQDELVDEVLGVDVAGCAARYVVSMYMTAVPRGRAEAVKEALREVGDIGHFWEPLREMERVAVEPLPQLDDFLRRWRALLEGDAGGGRRRDWDTDEDRWLREVVRRTDGAVGLGKIARSTGRAEDLRAWCGMLVESRDWKGALSAHEEAAEIVTDKAYWRGAFLDGAALAAQELGSKDLPARLERAWREAPSMPRLRRWLGSAGSRTTLKKRAAEALEICPEKAHRQRALLHVLLGDFSPAAGLLAAAPGLGWSHEEHPGQLLFPLFSRLLAGDGRGTEPDPWPREDRRADLDAIERMIEKVDEPRLDTPEVDTILEIAGVSGCPDAGVRKAILRAMRKAAEKRLEGVVANKRRRAYEHAALLVGTCAALDHDPGTAEWVAGIRAEYRRYPALQDEFDKVLGPGRGEVAPSPGAFRRRHSR